MNILVILLAIFVGLGIFMATMLSFAIRFHNFKTDFLADTLRTVIILATFIVMSGIINTMA